MTTAYHPQSNGMVERMHRRLKVAVVARCSFPHGLPSYLGSSSASGASLWSSLPCLPPSWCSARRQLSRDNSCRALNFRRRSFRTTSTASWIPSFRCLWSMDRLLPLDPCTFHLHSGRWSTVFVRRDGDRPSLRPVYDGPYRVVHRSDTYFCLAVGDREDSVSVSRLKPLLTEGPVVPAQPRRQGCPPRPKPLLAEAPVVPAQPRRRGRPPLSQASCGAYGSSMSSGPSQEGSSACSSSCSTSSTSAGLTLLT